MPHEEAILSAHPVSAQVRDRVEAQLSALEHQHQVTILFACESGSRGWGFASPDSDYDVRFVYVHRLAWYLGIEAGRDVIEQPLDDELDLSGWELRKALRLLRGSNPALLEWLRSPIVYRQQAGWVPRLRALARQGFAPERAYHHYVSMARRNLRGHLHGDEVRYKKYLYVLRPLLAARWIRQGLGVPPMRLAELAERTLPEPAVREMLNELLARKMRAGEAATSPRWPRLHEFIESEMAAAMAHRPARGPAMDHRPLDACLLEAVRHFDPASPDRAPVP